MHRHTNVREIITALVLLYNNTQPNEHRSPFCEHGSRLQGTSTLLRHMYRCIFPIELMPATTTASALRWGRGRCWRTHSYPSCACRQASYSARAASESG